MADLLQFREKVTIYRKRQDTSAGTPHTQQELARAIGLSADELGHRLRGTGRSKLTRENVLAIVRTLAEWDTLTWDETVELLVCMDYPLDPPGWKTELQHFLPPSHPDRHSSVTSVGTLQEMPSAPVRRRLFQARDLPEDYVPRPNAFNPIKRLLLTHEENQTTAITTALRGAGGFGKTTLASALCHDPDIQAAFPDGILWVELGEHPPGSLTVLNELLHALDPLEREALALAEARERWRHELEERSCLLVIDDVWQTEVLEELLQGGPRCGRLVTTRNDQLLPDEIKRVWVDAMEPEEAKALLCQGVVENWQHTLEWSVLERVVVQQLGCWPLLVSLARGMLTNQVRRLKKTPEQALALLEYAYEDRGMSAFHLGDRIERQRTADACVEVNLRQLEEWVPLHYQARQRYQELAVFPDDTDIPLTTLQTYWRGTGGLHAWEVEDLCLRLSDLSLLLPWNPEQGAVRLHDVMRSYLIQHSGEQLPVLHGSLLGACQQGYGLTRWADLPQSEGYLWQRLVSHLCQAGHLEALQTTLTDLLYLTRKALYVGVSALENDFLLASTWPSAQMAFSPVTDLYRAVRRSSHLLRRAQTMVEMGSLLLSYLDESLTTLNQRWALESELPRPFLTAWHPLPKRASSALIRTLRGHTGSVEDCAVSPDGQWIVSASEDHTLKIWDIVMGEERLTLRGHTAPVHRCVVSPDGRFILSASADHTLKIWDATSGAELRTLTGHTSSVYDCAMSPNSQLIISASTDGTLKVWDTGTGAELRTLKPHIIGLTGCGVSADNRFIFSACFDGTLKVWDAGTGAELRTLKGSTFKVQDHFMEELHRAIEAHATERPICRVSEDGRFIISAAGNLIDSDHTLKIWDTTSSTELCTLKGHTGQITGCAVSADSRFIVSASLDRSLKVWDTSTGAELRTFKLHTIIGRGCAVSPDGRWIVSTSINGTLNMWDATTEAKLPSLADHTDPISRCVVSPNGRFIVSAGGDIFECEDTLRVWDAANGAKRLTLNGHKDEVFCCGVSADSSFIVSTSYDQTLKVWDAVTGAERMTLRGHTAVVWGCAVSPDGHFIVSASEDKTLKVWDATTGAEQFTLTGHTGPVKGCTVSADGRFIVSASGDDTLKVWDATTGAERLTLRGHTNEVISCAVSADGCFIVSASSDKTLKVWDVTTGAELRTLKSHTDLVNNCAVSPNGRWIVSASRDKTLKVWEVQTGQCMLTFPTDGGLASCAFHPDGEHLVTGGEYGVYFLRLVM